ncbi:zinc finger protein 395-like isoform X2 [Vespa mandarinia]|uniref:zinc finger protein 395-like n=1 Tax=Vespa crabro TaxID=7445 RepID=UPI00160D9F14|nr:zinc finger protein 395-like isoform X2 [Vespa mandarinia]XP_046838278.1 zinc finger protein 395-like [Vespa crabro]XP_046838279.1 zinc finger protein 395-like [Vespa crabro]XP_046838281.1 zinc finger protein 395-like [Vespa crabro]XP_047356000.1 zinc finger protein 395-like isoform X2 [Vespa velutina]
MSTGKRLAKRSIIGTRVCAPGEDGKYYSGVIHAVKTPASSASESGLSITPKTRYSVRFDTVPGGRPPSPSTEYSDRDLIGPGFGSVTGARLVPGQKVYLTYNGREIQAEVTQHREHLDEVDVVIAPNGQEGTMSLTKRIEEVRLLESRKSARLADQDTDFARLADMAGDRKRASSHSIDVPHVIGSRKRRPSSSNDSERSYSGWSERIPHGCGREGCRTNERGDCMDECTAALVLMSLSCSPHSPHNPLPLHCQHNYGSWGSRGGGGGGVVVGSPGVGGTSNSSSSSSGASWRSGTPSPPLSDEGAPTTGSLWPTPAHVSHINQAHYPCNLSGSSSSSTPGSTITMDEGIVPDYLEEQHPRKKKIRAKADRDPIESEPGSCATFESEQANAAVVFKCTWKGCLEIKATVPLIEEHVRQTHLGPKKSKVYENEDDDDISDHEEEFYYQEVAVDHMSSPPTMSHRDMARPPHEDPEYQKQLRLEAVPVNTGNTESNSATAMPCVKERNNAFTILQSPGTPIKHIKLSPRPFQAYHQQSMGLLTVSTGKIPSSPRRIRGETKKCRKVYGMEHRDLWCTQCKWKKACSRFGD